MILLILLSASCQTIGAYINKTLTATGISQRDYFFYMCITILPFALIMMFFEPQKFKFGLIPLLLLCLGAVVRYYSQYSVVGMVRKLEPFQYQTWVTLTIILTFIIDTMLGTRQFDTRNLASILFTLGGILILTGFRLPEKSFRKDAAIRIICGIAQGYITFLFSNIGQTPSIFSF